MKSAVRWTVAVVLLVAVSPIVAGGAVAADSHQSTDTTGLAAPDSGGTPPLAVQTDDDNETERHRDPDDYEDEGDLEGLSSWLSGRLARQLGDSAIQLSEGEYELAREFIGDEYRDRLGQYVDVAGDIDAESDEETFRETRDQQQSLTDLLEQYQETKAAYDAAVAEGDTARARELARRLDGLADEIGLTTDSLQQRYEQIGSATGENLSAAQESLEEVENDILTEVSTILSSEFTETELTVDNANETISFLDPLSATGRLTTAEGEPLSNEPVRFAVGEQSIRTETDADGSFAFTYRPTLLSLSTSSLTVEYVPENRSLYLGSEASVNVTVEQVQPRLADVAVPDELAYAEPGRITGRLLVDDTPVDGVPVGMLVDDQQVSTLATNNGTVTVNRSFNGSMTVDGSFDEAVTVPASVPDGEQALAVRLSTENQALAPVSETRSVTVRETETVLSLDATGGDGELTVNGTLATSSGVGVGEQPIQLQIEGTTVGTVTTTAGGAFSETLTVPETVDEELVRVSATYRGAGSNLAGSENETVVSVTLADQSGGESEGVAIPAWLWVLLVVVFGSILGLVWLARTRDPDDLPFSDHPAVQSLFGSEQLDPDESPPGSTPENGATATDQSDQPAAVAALLQRASTELQSGNYGVAVQACYSAVRTDLAARIDGAEALTHWEFYQAYSESERTDSALDALQELTEEYERAAFSGDSVTQDHAKRVLARATKLCRVDDTPSVSTADD